MRSLPGWDLLLDGPMNAVDAGYTVPLSLAETAGVVSGYLWLEERLFEILGGWVPEVPEPEVKLRLAAGSHHHAWHASLWRERLPAVGDGGEEPVVAASPGLEAAVAALRSSPTTIEKLAGLYRVVLPRQLATYRRHAERASAITDGPILRALRLVGADELADWHDGELALQGLLSSTDDVQRAAGHQGRLEALLIGAG